MLAGFRSRKAVAATLATPLVVLLALAGCAAGELEAVDRPVTFEPLANPVAPGSGEPNLFAAADGSVWMSWVEARTEGHALRAARLVDDGWSEPQTITESTRMFVNWADFPSLVQSPGGQLLAHWLQRSGSGRYAYDVVISLSGDGGKTWSMPEVLHDDGVAGEHGFVSLVPDRDNGFTAVWLDGRHTTGESPRMTLRAARIGAGGAVTDRTELDPKICDCCQTSAAWVGESLVAVYRDRSESEIRDIWSVRRDAAGWHAPTPVAADGWQIPGCPVNGPSIAGRDGLGAVAWFALVDGAPEVKVAFTEDEGASFGEPILVAGPDPVPLGRVDIDWVGEQVVLVTWIVQTEEGVAEIRHRTVASDGGQGAVGQLALTSPARSSGFPRIAVAGGWLVAAWTIPGEAAEIRTARARIGPAGG